MTIRGNMLKIATLSILVVFLFVGTFGMSHMSMSMDASGNMTDCPFDSGVSLCAMDLFGMIYASQNVLTGLFQQKELISLLTLLAVFLYALGIFYKPFSPPKLYLARNYYLNKDFVSQENSIKELFSDGILNSKLF